VRRASQQPSRDSLSRSLTSWSIGSALREFATRPSRGQGGSRRHSGQAVQGTGRRSFGDAASLWAMEVRLTRASVRLAIFTIRQDRTASPARMPDAPPDRGPRAVTAGRGLTMSRPVSSGFGCTVSAGGLFPNPPVLVDARGLKADNERECSPSPSIWHPRGGWIPAARASGSGRSPLRHYPITSAAAKGGCGAAHGFAFTTMR